MSIYGLISILKMIGLLEMHSYPNISEASIQPGRSNCTSSTCLLLMADGRTAAPLWQQFHTNSLHPAMLVCVARCATEFVAW